MHLIKFQIPSVTLEQPAGKIGQPMSDKPVGTPSLKIFLPELGRVTPMFVSSFSKTLIKSFLAPTEHKNTSCQLNTQFLGLLFLWQSFVLLWCIVTTRRPFPLVRTFETPILNYPAKLVLNLPLTEDAETFRIKTWPIKANNVLAVQPTAQ